MDDDEKGYTWETEYERSWEAIQEDADGSLKTTVDDISQRAKRRRLAQRPANIRLGMMRHLFIIVDMSDAMVEVDMWPSRLEVTMKLLEEFLSEFFNQNPISQVSTVTTRNGRAERVTHMSGNVQHHIKALRKSMQCSGEPSLQNALQLAFHGLKNMPGHTSREVLVLMASLTTCDPGDISETIKSAADSNIQCSVIGLAAEVRVCRRICEATKGIYGVCIDETHYRELLFQHVPPPPAEENKEASVIRMGFPQHNVGSSMSYCLCHLESRKLSCHGYFCPQCKSKYCELPVDCKTCRLTLISAPHLARSYHHLFPLTIFKEIHISNDANLICTGCQCQLRSTMAYVCPHCQQAVCADCDVYIHDSLHSCPGCCSTSTSDHKSSS